MFEEDPEVRTWAQRRKETVLNHLNDSSVAVSLFSDKSFTYESLDPTQALEIGAMIMLDKPIILCVSTGTKVPERLVRVADAIVEFDEPFHDYAEANALRLKKVIQDLGHLSDGTDG